MREDDPSPTLLIPISSSSSSSSKSKAARAFVVKNRYKFWVLAAVLLMAFWSMFTGSVTLKWSVGNLTRLSDDIKLPTYDDLDILEVEDREKVVRHMWDLYTQIQNRESRRRTSRLPRFWQEAFEAAYDHLSSDVPAVRNAAISEIAKMSIRSISVVDPFPLQSKGGIRKLKKDEGKRRGERIALTASGSNS